MRKSFDEITRIAGSVVTVKAHGVGYDELAVVSTRSATSLGQVIRLERDQVSLQVFAGTQGGWRAGCRAASAVIRGTAAF